MRATSQSDWSLGKAVRGTGPNADPDYAESTGGF